MSQTSQREKAEAFRAMHDRSRILVLPNAWDAASARIFERAGFRAIATTSAGVAYALGCPDGEVVDREEMFAAIARMSRAVAVPLTADIESGFAADTGALRRSIAAVIEAGAIGINLEDSIHDGSNQLYPVETAVERVRAAREAGAQAGVPIVINARTDVFLMGIGEKENRLEHAVARANAYRAAGADCLFVPGVRDPQTIGALAKAIHGPINVLAGASTPPAPELQRLGVARVSVGSGPARAAMTVARRVAEELLASGTYAAFTAPDVITHAEAQKLMQ